jgi:hypothetical protein
MGKIPKQAAQTACDLAIQNVFGPRQIPNGRRPPRLEIPKETIDSDEPSFSPHSPIMPPREPKERELPPTPKSATIYSNVPLESALGLLNLAKS